MIRFEKAIDRPVIERILRARETGGKEHRYDKN